MKKGRLPESLSIDRKNPLLGYVPGNIRVMSFGANASLNDRTPCKPCVLGINVYWAVCSVSHNVANDIPF